MPLTLSLNAYPNPFSERFTIEFDVPSVNRVQLALYNVLGQKLQTIVDRTVSEGTQRIAWSTSEINLPSGMYFLRLQVGDKLLTRPISRIAR